MRINIIVVAVLIFGSHVVNAQDSLKVSKASRIDVHFQLGVSSKKAENGDKLYFPAIGAIATYEIHRMLKVGPGLSYDYYEVFSAVPIMLTITGDFTRKKITPFYYFQIGKAFSHLHDEMQYSGSQGGQTWALGAGCKFNNEKLNLGISVGYKNQIIETVDHRYYYWYDTVFAPQNLPYQATTWDLQRLEFKLWVGI